MLHRASLDQMINMDQPIHFELRREHLPFFTAKYVADLKVKVEAQGDDASGHMAPMGAMRSGRAFVGRTAAVHAVGDFGHSGIGPAEARAVDALSWRSRAT